MGNPVVHFELMGTDGKALQKFYSELFGWHVEHNPEMNYGIVDTHAGEGMNGGIGEPQEGGPYTTFYVAVDDTDAALKKIEKAGGKTIMPTMVIPNIVTMAMFSDPAGNLVGLVFDDPTMPQPQSEKTGNPEVGWFEVLGKDVESLAKFYSSLFGWKLNRNEMPGGMVYNEIDTGDPRGARGGIGSSFDGESHVTIYAGVDDITKTLERAETLGGKIVMPESKVTEQTTIGQFTDPSGNLFGLYKRMPH